jgi:hypothetical protein
MTGPPIGRHRRRRDDGLCTAHRRCSVATYWMAALLLAALSSGNKRYYPPCTLADCKDPKYHDQCRLPCGAGYRPNCTYCSADPDKHQCSARCSLGPRPLAGDPCLHWYTENRGLILPPSNRTAAARGSWWAHVLEMRADCQRNSDRSIYDVPQLQWTAFNYVQPQVSIVLCPGHAYIHAAELQSGSVC